MTEDEIFIPLNSGLAIVMKRREDTRSVWTKIRDCFVTGESFKEETDDEFIERFQEAVQNEDWKAFVSLYGTREIKA